MYILPMIAYVWGENKALLEWEYVENMTKQEVVQKLDYWATLYPDVLIVECESEDELYQYRSSSEIAEAIGNELEDGNYYSAVGIIEEICSVLKDYLKEDELKEVFLTFKDRSIFMD